MILSLVYLLLTIGHQLAYGASGIDSLTEEGHSFLPFSQVPTKQPVQSNQTIAKANSPSKVPSTAARVEVTSEMSVSPRIERIVLKENNYNVYPNTRPVNGQNNYISQPVQSYTWSQLNGTQPPVHHYDLRPAAAPTSCYGSLNAWRDDQRKRINSIFNLHRKNGSYIVDFRIQKPNSFIGQAFWSILPDGAQLYLLRQKELKAYKVLTDVQKRPCCYNNVYYDCVFPNTNGTVINYG